MAMIANQVAGKATRDALFLSNFEVTALPVLLMVASVASVGAALGASRAMTRVGPERLVPAAFTVSAGLLLLEWGLASVQPRAAAVAVYIHLATLGSILISGFWTLVNERFDPRTAKKRIGRIAAGGTLGGIVGGLLAERIGAWLGVAAVIPALAALHLVCAVAVRGVRGRRGGPRMEAANPQEAAATEAPLDGVTGPPGAQRSGWSLLGRLPYLRNLAVLVAVGTVAAALLDYVFKAQAAAAFQDGERLLRFFAIFYTLVGVLTFLVQAGLARAFLERLGLGRTVGVLPLTLAAGSIGALFAPGLVAVAAVRGGEAILRSSLFRSGYELLFTPLPRRAKRSSKAVIDVGFDRLGDAVGGALIRAVLFVAPAVAAPVLLVGAAALGVVGLVVALRLQRGYVHALEESLLARAVELDVAEVEDNTTRTTLLRSLGSMEVHGLAELRARAAAVREWSEVPGPTAAFPQPPSPAGSGVVSVGGATAASDERTWSALPLPPPPPAATSSAAASSGVTSSRDSAAAAPDSDPLARQVAALRSRNPERVRSVLESGPLSPSLAPHLIPLLAWDAVRDPVARALRQITPRVVGALTDALLDPDEEFAIRRRIPPILGSCGSERALHGLQWGLQDRRFEVRYRCGQALNSILRRNPELRVDAAAVFAAVRRELAVGKPVWESQRLLDRIEESEGPAFVDSFLRNRTSRSLEHVFALLALVLDHQPLQVAFRGLHTDDEMLRGTALEYLETVLPPDIRDGLWPFLEDRPSRGHESAKPREQILADLLRSNESIALNLEEIRRRHATADAAPDSDN